MEKEKALWKKVSESEREEILKEAKQIMDRFYSALVNAEKEAPESSVEREEFEREEKESLGADDEFREIMFKNAPKIKNECIEAEKGKWEQ